MSFLDELCFVGYDDKISAYQMQHVAMTWRDAFLLRLSMHEEVCRSMDLRLKNCQICFCCNTGILISC